jgi:hypothetical protein
MISTRYPFPLHHFLADHVRSLYWCAGTHAHSRDLYRIKNQGNQWCEKFHEHVTPPALENPNDCTEMKLKKKTKPEVNLNIEKWLRIQITHQRLKSSHISAPTTRWNCRSPWSARPCPAHKSPATIWPHPLSTKHYYCSPRKFECLSWDSSNKWPVSIFTSWKYHL